MNIFSKEDFGKEEIKYLSFSDDFAFDDSNKIIFGFNGIGKSSIYRYLKTTRNDCFFMDYETKPKFTGAGKKFTITLDLTELNNLINQKQIIKDKLSIKECFKQFGIITKADAESLRNEKFVNIFNSKDIFSLKQIEKVKYDKIMSYFKLNEIISVIENIDELSKIADIKSQIYDYSEKYLLEVFNILEGHYDEETKKCPVCGSSNVSLYKYIEAKKKELLVVANSLFGKMSYVTGKTGEEQEKSLREIVNILHDIDMETLVTICLSGGNYAQYETLSLESMQLPEINSRISDLESERDKFYKEMSSNQPFIKSQFEQIYKGSKIEFDEINKEIKIELPRNFKTYSIGEINELCLVIKILSFKGSNKNLLIVDDPLSSYDFINQYRMIFRLVKLTDSKKVVIFTHNIETINIVNTQHSNMFKYYYMEKLNSTLILEEIKSKKDSILSLESIRELSKYIDLLVYRENSEEGDLFAGHQVFHYDAPYTFTSYVDNETKFNGLTNDFFVDLIDNQTVKYKHSFEENIVTKILYICGIRVWIEKQIRDYILNLPEAEKTIAAQRFKAKKTTLEKLISVQSNPNFNKEFPKYNRENFMMKKVMLNQCSHYKSQIIPFNFAMNISLDNLISEIEDIKEIFKKK